MNTSLIEQEIEILKSGIEEGLDNEHNYQDLEMLLDSVLEYVKNSVDINEVDKNLTISKTFDITILKNLLKKLDKKELREQTIEFESPGKSLSAATQLDGLGCQLDTFNEAQKEHGESEAWIRLNGMIDGLTQTILFFDIPKSARSFVRKHIREALCMASNEDIVSLWDKVLLEFNISRRPSPMPQGKNILPDDFFKPAHEKILRKRITEYLSDYRPKLVRYALDNGQYTVPQITPGIGSLLTTKKLVKIPIGDKKLAYCLARIYDTLDTTQKQKLRETLGIAEDGYISTAEKHRRSAPFSTSATTKLSEAQRWKQKLHLFQRLLIYLRVYITKESPLGRTLLKYKLGLEVQLPESRKAIDARKDGGLEILLQKELSKYLLDHDIYAIGTRFGRSEIDLLVNENQVNTVIETKVYRENPTSDSIKSNISQLQTYMSQQQIAARGILAIYNLSGRTILAERRWMGGIFWILPINLQQESPSKIKSCLNITQGANGELLDIRTNNMTGKGNSSSPGNATKKPT